MFHNSVIFRKNKKNMCRVYEKVTLNPSGKSIFAKSSHMMMKRILAILSALLLSCMLCNAQKISDSGYRTVGYIKSDGTVQDSAYKTIGHIKSDGTIQDSSYKTIGHLKSDGTVQDASYKTVGHIKSDGTVQDSGYRTIGHIKDDGTVQDASYKTIGHTKDIPMEWIALYFFFKP